MTRTAHLSPTTADLWDMAFTPHPEAVGLARRQVRQVLAGSGVSSDVIETVALIVSELLTNAIRYCDVRHQVHAAVLRDGDQLRVEVSDPSDAKPTLTTAGPDDEGGRGLVLVQALAVDFGVRDRAVIGKTVWATVGGAA